MQVLHCTIYYLAMYGFSNNKYHYFKLRGLFIFYFQLGLHLQNVFLFKTNILCIY